MEEPNVPTPTQRTIVPYAQSPRDISASQAHDIALALNAILADVVALYFKTKNFHWHVHGPHFRDYHELLDEQATELFEMIDPLAERVRKLGQRTLTSVGAISRLQRIKDSDATDLDAISMLAELATDHRLVNAQLRAAHELCAENVDVASASLLENWIDASERRAWFLIETTDSRERS
jgi:starvation-inducible DNA-binding protein